MENSLLRIQITLILLVVCLALPRHGTTREMCDCAVKTVHQASCETTHTHVTAGASTQKHHADCVSCRASLRCCCEQQSQQEPATLSTSETFLAASHLLSLQAEITLSRSGKCIAVNPPGRLGLVPLYTRNCSWII